MNAPYVATAWWHPHRPDEWEAARGRTGHQPEPTVQAFDDLDAAETYGQQMGCLRGVRRVEVRSPDGELQALWDKESAVVVKTRRHLDGRGRMLYDLSYVRNRWRNVGAESQSLARRRHEEIDGARRAVQAAHDARRTPGSVRHTATSQEVVDHLRRARTAAIEGTR